MQDKKVKNLISAVILLAGLFVGSLFVDMAQLFQGGGFSRKNLDKASVFEADGKTWVAYEEPAVSLKVISDDNCEACDPSEVLVWMRRIMPTISPERISFDSDEGKELINKFGIKSLPAFVFDEKAAETNFYLQAQVLFEEKDGQYVLNTQELGLEPGKLLASPEIEEGDPVLGQKDAKVKVVVFSDFQCPYSKMFETSLRSNAETYGDRVEFSFKHYPLSFHKQAENAALASECANEQGKFWEYADKLFATQDEWGEQDGTVLFKTYASSMGLNYNQFVQCMDSKKYQDKVDQDIAEAGSFGITSTPSIFVGDQFKSGALDEASLGDLIESELNK